jgi:hypothetical protein
MMALGKDRHRIDVAHLHRCGKLLRVKIGSNIGAICGCMKVEMDLPETKLYFTHLNSYARKVVK